MLSNKHLQHERMPLYQTLCHALCSNLPRPVILVDRSDIVEQDRLMVIRTALIIEGRAITLYESIYPQKKYNSPKVHKLFLNELNALLPVHCVPIIVTDAGFLGPWFRVVEKLGWFWLGRVRNFINYRLHSSKTWLRCTNLNYRANKPMKYLELADLSS